MSVTMKTVVRKSPSAAASPAAAAPKAQPISASELSKRSARRLAAAQISPFIERIRDLADFIAPHEPIIICEPLFRCGLYCRRPVIALPEFPVLKSESSLPASAISIQASIKDQIVHVTMKCRYVRSDANLNSALEGSATPYRGPMEFEFELPLSETSAVTNFEATIGNRKLRSECKGKEEAKTQYNAAIQRGEKAALMESVKEAPNRFKFQLGNIAQDEVADIEISYLSTLDTVGPKLNWNIPVWMVPKYILSKGLESLEGKQLSGGNSLLSSIVGLNIEADIVTATAIEKIVCNYSDEIANGGADYSFSQSSNSKTSSRILFSARHPAGLTKPFELGIYESSPYAPHCLLEYCPETNTGCVQISLTPPSLPLATQSQLSCEILILIDRSGSMSGESIKSVRQTMSVMLKSLPTNCRFNIIGFGDNYECLFPNESRSYDDESLRVAKALCDRLEANLGGTELKPPFNYIYGKPALPGFPRQIFLLTDGGCSGVEQIESMVTKNVDTTRLFTFGIGSGVDRSLVTRLAAAGMGKCEFVSGSAEEIRSACLRQLNAALQPSFNRVSVNWNEFTQNDRNEPGSFNSSFEQVPTFIPGIFPNSKVLIYATNVQFSNSKMLELIHLGSNNEGGRREGESLNDLQYSLMKPEVREISIVCQSNLGLLNDDRKAGDENCTELEFILELNQSQISIGNSLHKLAARAKIKELTETIVKQPANKAELSKRIRELGLKWRLATSETSFVCVEDRPNGELAIEREIEKLVFEPAKPPKEKEREKSVQSSHAPRGFFGFANSKQPVSISSSSSSSGAAAAPAKMKKKMEKSRRRMDSRGDQDDEDEEESDAPAPIQADLLMFDSAPSSAAGDSFGSFQPSSSQQSAPAPAKPKGMMLGMGLRHAQQESKQSFSAGSLTAADKRSSSISAASTNTYSDLIDGQSATGAWKLNSDLIKILHAVAVKSHSHQLDEFLALAAADSVDPLVLGTILALLILKNYFQSRQSEWQLMAGKGQSVVKKSQIGEQKLLEIEAKLKSIIE